MNEYRSIHNKKRKGVIRMDDRFNTSGEVSEGFKKIDTKRKPSQNSKMSEAEAKMKSQGKK
jgi:hypothetical protein